LKKLIVHIKNGHQGNVLFTLCRILRAAASGAVGFDDPGAWGPAVQTAWAVKGGKKLLPRVQRGPAEVKTAKFQGKSPKLRAAEPEGDGKGQRTGPQVQDTIPWSQGEFQGGEQAAEAVQIPGEKVTEIGGKHGRLIKV
jgi:hypothetical protein